MPNQRTLFRITSRRPLTDGSMVISKARISLPPSSFVINIIRRRKWTYISFGLSTRVIPVAKNFIYRTVQELKLITSVLRMITFQFAASTRFQYNSAILTRCCAEESNRTENRRFLYFSTLSSSNLQPNSVLPSRRKFARFCNGVQACIGILELNAIAHRPIAKFSNGRFASILK